MRLVNFSSSVFLFIVFFNLNSFAQAVKETDPFDLPQIVAVENKKFNPWKDLTVQFGVMPLDAFYKAFTGGLSYTQSMNSYLSWEILNVQVAASNDTGLKKELLSVASVRPKGLLDTVKYYATTSAVYTPIYSKNLIFNKDILYGEWSFVGSGGLIGYTSGDSGILLGVGVLSRYFKTESTSYKFDGRLYYQTAANKSTDILLMLNFGIAFELGDKQQAGRSL